MLDTSVVIDLSTIPEQDLPLECAISAVTLAELAVGVHTAKDVLQRTVRQHLLQATEASFDVLPFDAQAARTYAHVDTFVRAAGRKPRVRMADLLIAATAIANDLPLLTRNPKDFLGLESIVRVVQI
ncbi:type II toxin-antitoxin system VapC family toxin [Kutzneria viridogrisea]|uniref:type II toxin-antitoxin system VapC family toxin n=1 Tax=Kutzneria viridogrisea TaxID=47990 RepID=UPI0031F85B14